jgi:hypothetical protein
MIEVYENIFKAAHSVQPYGGDLGLDKLKLKLAQDGLLENDLVNFFITELGNTYKSHNILLKMYKSSVRTLELGMEGMENTIRRQNHLIETLNGKDN